MCGGAWPAKRARGHSSSLLVPISENKAHHRLHVPKDRSTEAGNLCLLPVIERKESGVLISSGCM